MTEKRAEKDTIE